MRKICNSRLRRAARLFPMKARSACRIADHIQLVGHARLRNSRSFRISRMTVHRHVEALAKQGWCRKLHGAVTACDPPRCTRALSVFADGRNEEKQALARAALACVEPGQAIMLDDSSTASVLADHLAEAAPLTVVTNSVAAAERLQAARRNRSHLLGWSL